MSLVRWEFTSHVKQSEDVTSGSEWFRSLGHSSKTDMPVFLVWAEREVLSVDCARWEKEWKGAGNGKLTTHLKKNALYGSLLLESRYGWHATPLETCQQIASRSRYAN